MPPSEHLDSFNAMIDISTWYLLFIIIFFLTLKIFLLDMIYSADALFFSNTSS